MNNQTQDPLHLSTEQLIDAAVAKVEYCASPQAGLELYNFAKRKLDKITCPTC